MKRIVSLAILLTIGIGLLSFMTSEFVTKKSLEYQNYKLMIGEFSLKDLKSTVNKNWYESGYNSYEPKEEVVNKLSSLSEQKDYFISVYMGTWCPDSRREFPHLVKILDKAGFDLQNLKVIGVDRDKVVPNLSEKEREKLNVFNVPTIIVYDKNDKEVNRFVEFPQQTLEEDLLKIFSGEDYKHVYDF